MDGLINKILVLIMSIFLCGCKTASTLSTINPLYEDYLKAGEKPPKDVEKWIPQKKMEAKGMGKIEADFDKNKIKRDSGFKVPDVDVDLDKLSD